MGKLVFASDAAVKKKKMMISGGALLMAVLLIVVALWWHGGGGRQMPEAVSVSGGKNGGVSSTFLLRPDPTEVVAAVAAANEAGLPADLGRYKNARVLWPVYFFRIVTMDGETALVSFDANADGFGVSVRAEIDATAFPEIKRMQPGQKVWLAGEIVAADAAGTGSVRIKADYYNADGDLPLDDIIHDMAAHLRN